MFNNIGGKIKALAKVMCWIGIVMTVLSGIVTIVSAPAATMAPAPSSAAW